MPIILQNFFLQEIQANFTEDDSFGGGRLSTIPEVPSQATSVEEFDKILEEGPLPSSNESSPSFSNVSQNPVNSTKDESQGKDYQFLARWKFGWAVMAIILVVKFLREGHKLDRFLDKINVIKGNYCNL